MTLGQPIDIGPGYYRQPAEKWIRIGESFTGGHMPRQSSWLHTLRSSNAHDLVSAFDNAKIAGRPMVVLFDRSCADLHDPFVKALVESRRIGDHTLVFQGERIASLVDFYEECVRVMPTVASYFGRNLDALDEILRDRNVALATNSRNDTYWIWQNADVLFTHDSDWFTKLFTVFVDDARHVTMEIGLGSIGSRKIPGQPVFPVLTSRWDAMAEALMNENSFLHTLRFWYTKYRPDEDSGLLAFKVI